jgi:hypothetical protein
MNLLDLTVTLLAILLGIAGFREGLVRGFVKLAGFVIAVCALAAFAGPLVHLGQSIPLLPNIIAVPLVFVLVLVACMIVSGLIGEMVSGMVHLTPLGFVDSGFGTAFGVLKAVLIAGIIAFVLSLGPRGGFFYGQYASSRTGPGLARFVTHAIPFVASAGTGLIRHFTPRPSPGSSPPVHQGLPSNAI